MFYALFFFSYSPLASKDTPLFLNDHAALGANFYLPVYTMGDRGWDRRARGNGRGKGAGETGRMGRGNICFTKLCFASLILYNLSMMIETSIYTLKPQGL